LTRHFVEQSPGELNRKRRLADDDRHDRRLTVERLETDRVQPLAVTARSDGLWSEDVVEVDHFLLDLSRDVRHDLLVEVAVVLFFRVPDLGHAETLGVFKGRVKDEARLTL
jgi:hypothetical protein